MMMAAAVISIIMALAAPTPIWLRRKVAENMKVEGISVADPGPALVRARTRSKLLIEM